MNKKLTESDYLLLKKYSKSGQNLALAFFYFFILGILASLGFIFFGIKDMKTLLIYSSIYLMVLIVLFRYLSILRKDLKMFKSDLKQGYKMISLFTVVEKYESKFEQTYQISVVDEIAKKPVELNLNSDTYDIIKIGDLISLELLPESRRVIRGKFREQYFGCSSMHAFSYGS